MAGLTIQVERRPCWVKGRKGMFHRWIDEGGITYALIETEIGKIVKIPPTTITFLDHSDFYEYDWSEDKKKGDIQKLLDNLLEEFPVEVKGAE